MSSIDPSGMLIEGRVFNRRAVTIEHGVMAVVKAIVVHQTDAPTAQHTFNSWLVSELFRHFGLTKGDVYRHPEISYKNPGEASSAEWD